MPDGELQFCLEMGVYIVIIRTDVGVPGTDVFVQQLEQELKQKGNGKT